MTEINVIDGHLTVPMFPCKLDKKRILMFPLLLTSCVHVYVWVCMCIYVSGMHGNEALDDDDKRERTIHR